MEETDLTAELVRAANRLDRISRFQVRCLLKRASLHISVMRREIYLERRQPPEVSCEEEILQLSVVAHQASDELLRQGLLLSAADIIQLRKLLMEG